MSTKELKEITAQKKELAKRQKELREKLNETKEERKAARSELADARKKVKGQKAKLSRLTAEIHVSFSSEPAEEIGQLADGIMEVASELAGTVRKFAEAKAFIEEL